MNRRLRSLAICLLLVMSLLLGACGSAAENTVHAPILPGSARGQSQTDTSVPLPTAAVPSAGIAAALATFKI